MTTFASRGAFAQITFTEARLFARDRAGMVWGIAFPPLLLVVLGLIPTFSDHQAKLGGLTEIGLYSPILVAFAIAMVSLNAMPPTLSGYREKGILRRLSLLRYIRAGCCPRRCWSTPLRRYWQWW